MNVLSLWLCLKTVKQKSPTQIHKYLCMTQQRPEWSQMMVLMIHLNIKMLLITLFAILLFVTLNLDFFMTTILKRNLRSGLTDPVNHMSKHPLCSYIKDKEVKQNGTNLFSSIVPREQKEGPGCALSWPQHPDHSYKETGPWRSRAIRKKKKHTSEWALWCWHSQSCQEGVKGSLGILKTPVFLCACMLVFVLVCFWLGLKKLFNRWCFVS